MLTYTDRLFVHGSTGCSFQRRPGFQCTHLYTQSLWTLHQVLWGFAEDMASSASIETYHVELQAAMFVPIFIILFLFLTR
jgi:hypothetical protein